MTFPAITKGPWRRDAVLGFHIVGNSAEKIASLNSKLPNYQANASLIIAAPELYQAVKLARDVIAQMRAHPKNPWKDQEGEGIPVELILDQALAKARGES